MHRALVLTSGGLDSTTCLADALERFDSGAVAAVAFLYGQKHKKELVCAEAVAAHYRVPLHVLDISAPLQGSHCALLEGSGAAIHHAPYAQQLAAGSLVSTYVPFRNGLMLSNAAALALSLWPDDTTHIVIGAHKDDAAGNAYPDCSAAFTASMDSAIQLGTAGRARLQAPFVNINKAGIVARGLELGAPYALTWSCYEGGDKPCGACATCQDRAAAFAANGAQDPAL